MEEYMLFEDIQEEITRNYKSGGKIGFREAVLNLRRRGCGKREKIDMPDFFQWNMCNLEELKNLVSKIPVPVSRITSVVPSYKNSENEVILPGTVPVQISMECAYTSDVYTSLKEYFTILYMMDGSCELSIKNDTYSIKAGDIAILAPEIPYKVTCTEKDFIITIISRTNCFEDCFFGMIQKNMLMRDFFRKTLYDSQKEYMLFNLPIDLSVLQIIQNLFIESLREDAYSLDVFMNYLQIFYAKILRCPEKTFKVCRTDNGNSGYTVFPAILQYIQKNYQSISLQSLAEKFHYHPVYLSTMIKENTGYTLTQIIKDLKMKQAVSLLENTELSIAEISKMSGYHSTDHFTAMFKKNYGSAPRQYRKSKSEKSGLTV